MNFMDCSQIGISLPVLHFSFFHNFLYNFANVKVNNNDDGIGGISNQ